MIEISFGVNPARLIIEHRNREPLIIYDKNEADHFVYAMIECYRKAWPDREFSGNLF